MSDLTEPATEPQALHGDETGGGGIAIARQPIVDEAGGVFGYELFDRARATGTHDAASDAQLLFNVLSHADSAALIDNRIMFVNCAHGSLAGGHLDLVQPDRIVLEIAPVDGDGPSEIDRHLLAMTDVARRGFRFAFNQTVLEPAYQAWLPLASFIKIDLQQVAPGRIEPVVRQARQTTQARLIAEKVETAAQHQLVADQGINLFQGYWFAKPVVVTGQTIRPAHAVIIQLISLVRQQASTAEIEELLKHDASPSFNLLRFINSAGFGLSTQITSFRHAAMLLGLKKLLRWAVLLLTTSREGGPPPAAAMTAIVRGRLMELLAAELLPPEECDNAFITGVFSLLDTMLGMPMDKALGAISLPEPVVAALLLRRGPLAAFLELSIACESADEEAFSRAARELGLDNQQINWAHLQALAWAETLAA